MVDEVDVIVIGAGVVGLAVAKCIAETGREVLVLEAADRIGTGTSSRNSGVIHAGIYYAPETLKSRLCKSGRDMLYRYCAERSIPYARCGKLIVGVHSRQKRQLKAVQENAIANGVTDLRWLDRREMLELEPNVDGEFALLSPSTGIVDGDALLLSLHGDIEAAGGLVIMRTPVISGKVGDGGVDLEIGPPHPISIRARAVVNSAGLFAQAVARSIRCVSQATIPDIHLAKGHYYSYSGDSPFRRLIYPVPEDGGLGIHATLDLGGQVKFGPDVRWVDALDYTFDDSRRGAFIDAIRPYYPALDPAKLQPAYTGIRPKLSAPGESAADFHIIGNGGRAAPTLVHLFGIESPGLTASLAIGEFVTGVLGS